MLLLLEDLVLYLAQLRDKQALELLETSEVLLLRDLLSAELAQERQLLERALEVALVEVLQQEAVLLEVRALHQDLAQSEVQVLQEAQEDKKDYVFNK